MKLRIHKNSIRLRLSQSDITAFGSEGACIEELPFTNSSLKYVLKRVDQNAGLDEPVVDLEGNEVVVLVPFQIAKTWIESDEMVGFHNKAHENDSQDEIRILVEKDFQCLHKRPHEDETDSFPNPLAD